MKSRVIINREKTFYIILCLYIIQEIFLTRTKISDLLGNTLSDVLVTVLRAFIIGFALLKLFYFDKLTFKRVVFLGVVFTILIISTIVSHTTAMFLSVLVILCSGGVDFDRIVRVNLYLILSILVISVLLNLSGFISSATRVRTSLGTTRTSLGFNHPNTLAMVVFLIVADYLYLNRSRGVKKLLFPILATAFSFFFTYSFTAIVLMTILIAVVFFQTILERKNQLTKKRLRLIVIIVLIVFVGFILFFWNNPNLLVNEFRTFRSRFTLSRKYINAYGISLFGHKIAIGSYVYMEGYGFSYGFLDNGIIRILVELGIVFFILFFGLYLNSLRRMIRSRNSILIIISLVFLVYSFMEYNPLLLAYNVFLIQVFRSGKEMTITKENPNRKVISYG